ncbi:hypothetical protein BGS1_21750 [Clostridium beijerinckii]|nr:hypothetical protein BGS1_21750 [Clostridium beijerinckii]
MEADEAIDDNKQAKRTLLMVISTRNRMWNARSLLKVSEDMEHEDDKVISGSNKVRMFFENCT